MAVLPILCSHTTLTLPHSDSMRRLATVARWASAGAVRSTAQAQWRRHSPASVAVRCLSARPGVDEAAVAAKLQPNVLRAERERAATFDVKAVQTVLDNDNFEERERMRELFKVRARAAHSPATQPHASRACTSTAAVVACNARIAMGYTSACAALDVPCSASLSLACPRCACSHRGHFGCCPRAAQEPIFVPRHTLALPEQRELALAQLQRVCDNKCLSVRDFLVDESTGRNNANRIFAAHELLGQVNPSAATKLTVQVCTWSSSCVVMRVWKRGGGAGGEVTVAGP